MPDHPNSSSKCVAEVPPIPPLFPRPAASSSLPKAIQFRFCQTGVLRSSALEVDQKSSAMRRERSLGLRQYVHPQASHICAFERNDMPWNRRSCFDWECSPPERPRIFSVWNHEPLLERETEAQSASPDRIAANGRQPTFPAMAANSTGRKSQTDLPPAEKSRPGQLRNRFHRIAGPWP